VRVEGGGCGGDGRGGSGWEGGSVLLPCNEGKYPLKSSLFISIQEDFSTEGQSLMLCSFLRVSTTTKN
jgi:hypothetical protein